MARRYRGVMQSISMYGGSESELFDPNDPAPWGERKISPDVIGYILGELNGASREAVSLVVYVDDPREGLEEALRGGFAASEKSMRNEVKEVIRNSLFTALIAAIALLVLLLLAVPAYREWGTHQPPAVQAFFVIVGWVIIWRPFDSLLFDWWAVGTKRRRIAQIREGSIVIRRVTAQEV
jgi:hypothetical protein